MNDNTLVDKVIEESKHIVKKFEMYISDEIEKDFPEGMQAIQERRLRTHLLHSEKNHINNLGATG